MGYSVRIASMKFIENGTLNDDMISMNATMLKGNLISKY